jgi:hypothetical protein
MEDVGIIYGHLFIYFLLPTTYAASAQGHLEMA